jgi:gas vesicle protein
MEDQNTLGERKDDWKDKGRDASNKIEHEAEEAKKEAIETWSDVKQTGKEVWGKTKEEVQEAAGTAEGALEDE